MPTRFPLACRLPLLALVLASTLAGCTAGATATAGAPVPVPASGGLFGNQGAAAVPAAGTTASAGAPIAGGATAAGTTTLATGAAGTLTRDGADAFVDAFQFSLAQAGKPKTFTAAEREQLIQTLAAGYAKATPQVQASLANARATWTQAQANWAAATPQEQAAFVDGVLAIGVGEQGAAQLTGRAAATGTGTGGGEASGGGDSWSQEAKEKCENGSYEDKMFYCHGVITPSVSW